MKDSIFEVIRSSWNQSMPLHQKITSDLYDDKFRDRSYTVFTQEEVEFIQKNLQPTGKNVIQLCCNNGVELMSFKNLGANRCVGIDICDEAIHEANQRVQKLGYDIDYIRSNVYEIDTKYYDTFDILYLSVGTMRWLPDLSKLFSCCNKLLRKGGKIYIHEVHPIAEIINDDRYLEKQPLELVYSFDQKECLSDYGSLDYVGHTDDVLVERIWFIHSFTDILGELLKNNLNLNYFQESTDDIADVYHLVRQNDIRVPLSYKLIASK